MRRKPPPILGIFLTVFIDLLSFGLLIPDIQLRGKSLGATGTMLGLLIASFSIAQLIASPFLGRLSDRVGRRKILLVTTTLAACSYLVYSHALWIWVMLLARILNGLGGANIGVAYAYIADVTTPENRSKGMGMVGAAFGLGFIFGPPLGAALLSLGHDKPYLIGYFAAALAATNFLYVYFFLPESVQAGGSHSAQDRIANLQNFVRAFKAPTLGWLLAMFFATNFGFSNMESTFFRMGDLLWQFDKMHSAFVMFIIGVVNAMMQGGVVRVVIPRYGEVNVLRVAYFCQIPALALLPFVHPWLQLLIVCIFLGTGIGLTQPSLAGLISKCSPEDMQGGVFGVSQSLGALARILGPIVGNTLFDIKPWMPYVFGAGIVFIPMIGSWGLRDPRDQLEPEPGLVGT